MKITGTNSKTERRSISEGTHIGTVVQVLDLGEQVNIFAEEDNPNKTQRKVYITFEVADERLDDGRPLVIGQELTASLSTKSRLRPTIESLLGRPLVEADLADATQTLKSILGRSAFVEVEHVTTRKGTTFAKIKNVMKLSKGISVESPYNDLVFLDLDDEQANEIISGLPKFIQAKIAGGVGRIVPNSNGDLDL